MLNQCKRYICRHFPFLVFKLTVKKQTEKRPKLRTLFAWGSFSKKNSLGCHGAERNEYELSENKEINTTIAVFIALSSFRV